MQRSLIGAVVVVCCWSAFAACGSDERAGSGGTSGAGAAAGASDGSGASGGSSGSGGSGAVAGSAGTGPSCGTCGQARAKAACSATFAACSGDPGCKAISDCVYGPNPGCALGENGAQCVETCVITRCTSDASAKLFLEAERCAYCDADCAPLCTTYCGAFSLTPDSVTCPNLPDAGSEAGDAADAEPADAAPSDAAGDSPAE